MDPRDQLRRARRLVVKVGTGVVTEGGVRLSLSRLHGVMEDVAALRAEGRQVILVSSGAIAVGARTLGLTALPASLGLRQACAAVGQGKLLELYSRGFEQLGQTAAQVLLAQEDLADRDRALCLRTTLLRLLELGVVPVLNENDSVSVREIIDDAGVPGGQRRFGDNDGLAARVAVAVDADALLLLSNVDGVRSRDPREDPQAPVLPVLGPDPQVSVEVAAAPSSGGRGGMASKVAAARTAAQAGVVAVIASGLEPGIARRIVAGEPCGTLVPSADRRPRRRRWIAVEPHRGALVVNEGAIEALARRKASLLPVGVVAVEGDFARGDVVEIRDTHGRVHGRGLANYPAGACRRIAGHRSDAIEGILGYRGYDAVVSRDNLVWEDV